MDIVSKRYNWWVLWIMFFSVSCSEPSLHIVTVGEFQKFVEETGYVTDAEKFNWSVVQNDVLHFDILYGIDWRCPNGLQSALQNDPVLQVSYNDALAFAQWTNTKLPSYETYWDIVQNDTRPINKGTTEIMHLSQVNIIGNTWELTTPDQWGRIRLAGGSYLCDDNTCNGTDRNRELYVDPTTGNSHIGFAIIK